MSSYPIIPDFEAYLRERAPGVLSGPNAWAVTTSLLEGFGALDDTQVEMIRQMDPNVATGGMLDLCGARVFEDRGGLNDTEYRRIIMGRTVANVARGTFDGVWRTWLALSDAPMDRARILRWGPVDEPLIYLWASYDFVPSVSFLRRAGAVMLDAVAYPFDVAAFFVPSNGLYLDSLPGFDSGIIPYQLYTVRA